jgi:hypothetical protein
VDHIGIAEVHDDVPVGVSTREVDEVEQVPVERHVQPVVEGHDGPSLHWSGGDFTASQGGHDLVVGQETADAFMGNDHRAGLREGFISARVVEVPVGVDEVRIRSDISA